jgi:putative ABC transport system permease protein
MLSLWTMVVREIAYRKTNFALGLAGVSIATGLLIGVLTCYELHRVRSEQIADRQASQAETMMAALRSDVRNAMHRLGFNAIILPKDQPLADWYAEDYASKTMPEAWASRLDDTKELVDRYLPRLRQKLDWSEQRRTILVVGLGVERILDASVGGESRLSEDIPPGSCVAGYELHNALGLRPGQEIVIRDRRFRIAKCERELGTKDDITVWMNLADAQQLAGKPQLINEIMLVEHLSVWGNLAQVRGRIAEILPDCQVVQVASDTLSRAHARIKTAEEARAAVEHERSKQALLRAERDSAFVALLPLGSLACVCWIGFLAYQNVRDRLVEMASLMAIGFRAGDVRLLVVSKAVVLGFAGGIVGCVLGIGIASLLPTRGQTMVWIGLPTALGYFGIAQAMGLATSILGGWLPAHAAAGTDPAEILREE